MYVARDTRSKMILKNKCGGRIWIWEDIARMQLST
jgi:hypothetical protein